MVHSTTPSTPAKFEVIHFTRRDANVGAVTSSTDRTLGAIREDHHDSDENVVIDFHNHKWFTSVKSDL